jgi:hypothetical protein
LPSPSTPALERASEHGLGSLQSLDTLNTPSDSPFKAVKVSKSTHHVADLAYTGDRLRATNNEEGASDGDDALDRLKAQA